MPSVKGLDEGLGENTTGPEQAGVGPGVLNQELPERHLGLQLEDLEKRLKETPSYKTFERRLVQGQIDRLKNRIRADHGAEEIPEPPKLGLNEHAGAERGGVQAGGKVVAAEDASLARAQFTAHFGVLPVTDSIKRGLDRIGEGFARAKDALLRNGQDNLAREVDWFETRYTQAYLEQEALPHALTITKRALDAGYQVIIAVERRGELRHRIRPLEYVTLGDLDAICNCQLTRILPELRDGLARFQAQFGNVADYCGGAVDYERRRELRKDFLAGRFRVLYTTFGAGTGTLPLCDADYPELGIVGGTKPRVSIFLAAPRSAHLVMDAALLTWRTSAKSDVHAVFLSTDSSPDAELLQQKVGPLLRAIGGTVVGERISVSEQFSAMTEGARETALEAALAFAEGKAQKVNATMFQVRSKSRQLMSIDDWSEIDFPPAESAKRKQCNTAKELLDSEVRYQYVAAFGMKPDSSDDGASSAAAIDADSKVSTIADSLPLQAQDSHISETASASAYGEIAEKGMLRLRESMRNADLMAVAFVAILISILGFLITHNAPAGLFKTFGRWSLADVAGLLSLLAVAIASGMMLAVLYPKPRSVEDGSRVLDAMTRPKSSLSLPARVAAALQEDFYEMSVACAAKYRALHRGFWVGVVAALLSLIFVILSKQPHPRHYPY